MFSFTSKVRYSEVDAHLRLTIPALVDYLQDCSTFHGEAVGRGFDHIARTQRAWLLAGWEIVIDRMPCFGEEIRVSTWATGFKGLLASRNFTVCAAGNAGCGQPLVRADSRWFMFDAVAGKPIRIPEEESGPYLPDVEHDAPLDLPRFPRHIRADGSGEAAAPVTVTTAHIDTNHHVNNAQYVSMALGALPEGTAERVRRLDVQYREAAKLGDMVFPHVHEAPDGRIVTLDDGAGAAYAVVRLEERTN